MKRLFALLLALALVLCGCGKTQPPAPSADSTTQPGTTSTDPTEPEGPYLPNYGIYNPDSTVESTTNGAIREYTLDIEYVHSVAPMGEGMLVFSGEEDTTLTYLSDTASPVTLTIPGLALEPDGKDVRITDTDISYYDYDNNSIVTLDASLKKVNEVKLTTPIPTAPLISEDGKKLYYFDETSLRCMDLSTGISRLLKECSFATQEIWGQHFDGSLLECYLYDGDNGQTIFVSAATGETLHISQDVLTLYTQEDRFLAEHWEGVPRYIFGDRDGQPQCLVPKSRQHIVYSLLELNALFSYEELESGTVLYYYDLNKGTNTSAATMEGLSYPWAVTADTERGLVWFLAQTLENDTASLYCWDPILSATNDETSYLTPYYTADEPDTEGLEALIQQAKDLGKKYDLRIRLWEDALKTTPDTYFFDLEYLTQVYEENLAKLEAILAKFPKGFFKTLGKQSSNGIVTISLVRGIHGDNDLGSLDSAYGVHYWNDGSVYIGLAMGEYFEQSFYHEMFHSIDSHVLTSTQAYDNWDSLNPSGFAYDYDYIANQFREDYQYLEDETRAFVDMYSMSYPKEDRARIMEYCMMPEYEYLFESEIMQAKLTTLCKGIREAFGLKKYAELLPWEQYLEVSLAP